MKKETIICAAIHFDDGLNYVHQPKNIDTGIVVAGRRHHNCFITKHTLSPDFQSKSIIQGFLTSEDRFLTREDAYTVAIEANQLVDHPSHLHTLFSEDLY